MGLALILFVVLLGAKAAAGDIVSEQEKTSLETVLSVLEEMEKKLPARAEIRHSFDNLKFLVKVMLRKDASEWTLSDLKPIWVSLVVDLKGFEKYGHIDSLTVQQLIRVTRELDHIRGFMKPETADIMIKMLNKLEEKGAPMEKLKELISIVDNFS